MALEAAPCQHPRGLALLGAGHLQLLPVSGNHRCNEAMSSLPGARSLGYQTPLAISGGHRVETMGQKFLMNVSEASGRQTELVGKGGMLSIQRMSLQNGLPVDIREDPPPMVARSTMTAESLF